MRLDRLYSVNLQRVRRMVMSWLTKGQDHQPETLVTSSAITFLALCERFGVSPRRALEVADRVMRDSLHRQQAEIKALQLYLRHELRD